MKKRLLSGVKPTGVPHIGNYFGAMRQFVDLQKDYEAYIMIADYHALNFIQNKKEMEENILGVTLDYLGIGLDPKKVVIFKQSDVSAHTELAWIFDTITTMPYLMRAHAFKDALAKNKAELYKNENYLASRGKGISEELLSSKLDEDVLANINVGTFNYPMLMAADILLYDPEIVPVGSDQKQHVEYARDTAQKFNNLYGETFIMPKELIMKEVATVPGTDGQKMSKSYKNTIPLFGTDEEIKKSIMSIVTDSKTPEEPKDPETCNIFALHKLFLNEEDLRKLADKYKKGGMSYKESKEMLLKEVLGLVTPMRVRRDEYAKNINKVKQILKDGSKKASKIAEKKMQLVRSNIGVSI